MTNISRMQVIKHLQKLPNNNPQFILTLRIVVRYIWEREILHDKKCCPLLDFNVESLIVADRRMIYFF